MGRVAVEVLVLTGCEEGCNLFTYPLALPLREVHDLTSRTPGATGVLLMFASRVDFTSSRLAQQSR